MASRNAVRVFCRRFATEEKGTFESIKDKVGETMSKVGQAFEKEGVIGKQFTTEGSVGGTAQKAGGPFDKEGKVGKQFEPDGSVGGRAQGTAERAEGKGQQLEKEANKNPKGV